MAERIVIEANNGNLNENNKILKTLKKGLVDVLNIMDRFSQNSINMKLSLNTDELINKVSDVKARMNSPTEMKYQVILDINGDAEKKFNEVRTITKSFMSEKHTFNIDADITAVLGKLSFLKEELEKEREVELTVKGEPRNSTQGLPGQSDYVPPTETAESSLSAWKNSFKKRPAETTFMAAMTGAEIYDNFSTLHRGYKKVRNFISKKSGVSTFNGPRLPSHMDSTPSKGGFVSRTVGKAKDFMVGKLPKEKVMKLKTPVVEKFSSGAKSLVSFGGNSLKSFAGKAGMGMSAVGPKAAGLGTKVFSSLGVAGTAGAAVTVLGVADGAKDVYKGLKADNQYDKKYETTKGAAKITSTLAGAAAGTAILPGVGTLFGGIAGYFLGKIGGKKVAEKVAGGSEGAAAYADKSENAAIKVAKENTPVIEKFDEKLATMQNEDDRSEMISAFVDKMSETTEALTTLAQRNLDEGKEVPENILTYLNAMGTYQQMLDEGNPANVYGSQSGAMGGAPNSLPIYDQGRELYTDANAAGAKGTEGLTAPIQLVLNGEKEIKDKIEVSAKDFGIKSSVNATVQVNIDVIPQVTTHITGGGQKKGNRKKKFRGGIVGGGFPGFAEGGYVQGGAQLITVAEEGTPEAIIPLGRHRRKRAMELFSQVGSYLQAPGFSPKGFAAGGIVGGSIGGGFGGGMPAVVEVGGVEIKVEAKDGQNLVETIRENKEAISEEIAGVFNAAFKGQFANTPASGGVSA